MKIGIFDSGIGGLSVLHQAMIIMPEADYIFYADVDNVPYGEKTKEEVCWATLPNGIAPTNTNNIILFSILFITSQLKRLSILSGQRKPKPLQQSWYHRQPVPMQPYHSPDR